MYASPDVPSVPVNGILQLLAYHFMILYLPIIFGLDNFSLEDHGGLRTAQGYWISHSKKKTSLHINVFLGNTCITF